MTDILIFLLPYMLRFLNDPQNNKRLIFAAFVGFIADILMNNTTVPIFTGTGAFEEWTFSDRLERVCAPDYIHPDKQLFIQIGLKINREAGYPHILILKDMA